MNRRSTWLQALDEQIEQYLWLRSPDGSDEYRRMLGDAEQVGTNDEGLDLRQEHRNEILKLLLAEPVFVTAEMAEVIAAAATVYTPEPLLETDLLIPTGFLVFERPIIFATGPQADTVMPHGGFSWVGTTEGAPGDPAFGIRATLYQDWDELIEAPRKPGVPRLKPAEMLVLTFGDEPEPHERQARRLIQATFRLMAEFKPASRYSTKERPDRATRKSAKRAGLPEREILVVRLRRERTLAERLGGSADYAYRFMVSGHWRNQWFPSTNQHRQVWISPYVKGPDDKPFKPPQGRVFNLDR